MALGRMTNMTWRDWTGLVGLILVFLGNWMSFLENESVAYAGRFMVTVACFVVAVAWPYGANV